jgi:hypothetical protein
MPPKKKTGPPAKSRNNQSNFQSLDVSAIPEYTLEDWTRIAEGSNRAADFVRNHPPPPPNAPLIDRENYYSMVLDVFLGRQQGSGIGSSRVAPGDVDNRNNRPLHRAILADNRRIQNRNWYQDLFEDVNPIETFENDMKNFIETWKYRILNTEGINLHNALRIINGTYYRRDHFSKELEEYRTKLRKHMNELSPPYRAQNDARMRRVLADYSLEEMKYMFRTWILQNFHGLAERL